MWAVLFSYLKRYLHNFKFSLFFLLLSFLLYRCFGSVRMNASFFKPVQVTSH